MATTTGQNKSNLIFEVRELMNRYQHHKMPNQCQVRNQNPDFQKGCDELYEHIKELIPEKVKRCARGGHDEARIFEFKYKDELKFNNCYAKDLLARGNVIERLQQYLDTEHSDGNGPSFLVYFTHIGRYQPNHGENKYGVFVNWNKTKWDAIKTNLKIDRKNKMVSKHSTNPNLMEQHQVQYKKILRRDPKPQRDQELPATHQELPATHQELPLNSC
ncbi:MAG: hypothetical protein ABIN35_00180 [candidate division WOR-3 bacterium]